MDWDYYNWLNGAIQSAVGVIGLAVALGTLYYLAGEYQRGKEAAIHLKQQIDQVNTQIGQVREQMWVAAFNSCEESFSELQQMLFSDPEVAADYVRLNCTPATAGPPNGCAGPAEPGRATSDRLFIFYETYYGHLARVYVLTHRKANRAEGTKYWEVFDNFLGILLRSEHFRRVHEVARMHRSFEDEFVNYIDARMARPPAP
jgi:hypothetical protein